MYVHTYTVQSKQNGRRPAHRTDCNSILFAYIGKYCNFWLNTLHETLYFEGFIFIYVAAVVFITYGYIIVHFASFYLICNVCMFVRVESCNSILKQISLTDWAEI